MYATLSAILVFTSTEGRHSWFWKEKHWKNLSDGIHDFFVSLSLRCEDVGTAQNSAQRAQVAPLAQEGCHVPRNRGRFMASLLQAG